MNRCFLATIAFLYGRGTGKIKGPDNDYRRMLKFKPLIWQHSRYFVHHSFCVTKSVKECLTSILKHPHPWGVTWVHFCWVWYVLLASQNPFLHYSLFLVYSVNRIDTLATFGQMIFLLSKFQNAFKGDPILVSPVMNIHPAAHSHQPITKQCPPPPGPHKEPPLSGTSSHTRWWLRYCLCAVFPLFWRLGLKLLLKKKINSVKLME